VVRKERILTVANHVANSEALESQHRTPYHK